MTRSGKLVVMCLIAVAMAIMAFCGMRSNKALRDARTLLHLHGDGCEAEAMRRYDEDGGYEYHSDYWAQVAGKCREVREEKQQ